MSPGNEDNRNVLNLGVLVPLEWEVEGAESAFTLLR